MGKMDGHTYLLKKGIARNISVAAILARLVATRRISGNRILSAIF
jgi:hypothetical protein